MSRLFVSNLPPKATEERLREFFSHKGEVTDARIMRTKDGKSRHFAFVGFRTMEEAEGALKYFNQSYMDTRRITCEIARKVGDSDLPRPWGRHALKKASQQDESVKSDNSFREKSLKSTTKHKGSLLDANINLKGRQESDPKFQEFLEAMQPRSKAKMWANDIASAADVLGQVTDNDEVSRESQHKTEELKRKSSLPHPSEDQQVIDAGDAQLTDTDYFKSKITKNWSDSESENDGPEEEETLELHGESLTNGSIDAVAGDSGKDDNVGKTKDEGNNDNPSMGYDERNLASETGRLLIRNLPYTTSEEDLEELFRQFGDVSEVHIVLDKNTRASKGYGFVLFSLPDCAVRALELNNSIFQGRLLHVMAAKPQCIENTESDQGSAVGKKTFKQLREEQRKASEVSGDTRAWNSFYMHQDTVVENMARKHGISKRDFIDRESDDLAVRIALAETQIVSETKKALSAAGVNIGALEEHASRKNKNINRSNNVILVKNLPFSSSAEDLGKMFGKYGSLDRVILPPTRALALIVFLEAAEAHAAFKGLAYKRYEDLPLYLEMAPDNILSPAPHTFAMEKDNNIVSEMIVNKLLVEENKEGVAEEDLDPDRLESRSVFVKNINFNTSDQSLKLHFESNIKSGSIKSVKVNKHIKNGKTLSKGFGFIEFDSVETARNVCKDLQGTVLDSHALILQLCRGKTEGQVASKKGNDESSTKLLVRNIAFEATKNDIRQLFSPFGQIKSVRLPMKFKNHRGFAFVEYVTKQEAQKAFEALSNTHLYGRHLVIERAKEGESLDELRERTAAQFVDDHGLSLKLSKKRKQANLLDQGSVKFSRIVE